MPVLTRPVRPGDPAHRFRASPGFHGFIKGRCTTLQEAYDRILATKVTARWANSAQAAADRVYGLIEGTIHRDGVQPVIATSEWITA